MLDNFYYSLGNLLEPIYILAPLLQVLMLLTTLRLLKLLRVADYGNIGLVDAFALSFLSIIACFIGFSISTNIYLSLGMLGALSVIRFRTPVRNISDLVLIFYAVTMGISSVSNLGFPLLLSLFTIVLALLFRLITKGGADKKTIILSCGKERDDLAVILGIPSNSVEILDAESSGNGFRFVYSLKIESKEIDIVLQRISKDIGSSTYTVL